MLWLKRFFYLLSALMVWNISLSQAWSNLLPNNKKESSKISLYEIQDAFNKYWENKNLNDKSVTKGKGYKQFKRWENWMIPRSYPDGYITIDQTWKEFQKEKKKKSTKNVPVSDWKSVGPNNVPLDNESRPSGLGRINCVAFHPSNPDVIYTGSPSGGFWKTSNGGITWTTTTDELPSTGISDIAINPENPNIIYIATGDGDAGDTYSVGILKSTDGGITWNTTGLSYLTSDNQIIRKILINPVKPDTILAATNSGIYKSNDAGITWLQIRPGHFKDIEFKSGNPEIVYAARYGTNSSKFYKSTDGGASFDEILTGVNLSETYRLELAVGNGAGAGTIYALYSNKEDDGFHSFLKSTDDGNTWTKVYDKSSSNLLGWTPDGSDLGGQGWYDLSLVVSPVNKDEIYLGGINIWKSLDAGISWELVSNWTGSFVPYVHADHHCLVYSPAGILYNGNDGGLYKTSNNGLSWSDISHGLKILQIDRIGISQLDPDLCIVGNMDNGTMKYDQKTGSWTQIFGGDGCECIMDYSDSQTIYISYIKGDIKRSDDGGNSFTTIKPPGAGEGQWHTPYIMDLKDNKTLYAGYSDIWKTTDKGTTWQRISTNISPGNPLRQIAVAPSNPDYIYLTNGIKIWKTADGGQTWKQLVNTELSGLFVTYFAISSYNPEKVWISISGYSEGNKVFYTENAGLSWINYSDGLPNVPVNCIIQENNSNDVLYIGTDIGVYYRDASMTQWERFSTGLPNVEVSELEIQYKSSKLYAGTRGRGLYETSITLSEIFEDVYNLCFIDSIITIGWATEILSGENGKIPAIDFIKSSINPPGFLPVKCSHFARFNSFTCESGDKLRFKMTNSIPANNCDSLRLTFQMTTDNEYPESNDTLITQWSVNGQDWFSLDTLTRYNPERDSWIQVINALPDQAENQANLYIGFLFISAYGNDIHLNNINIQKVFPESPRYFSSFTNEAGNEIEIKFTKEMVNPEGKQSEFTVNNGNIIVPAQIHLKNPENYTYLIELPEQVEFGQMIKISYTKGTVTSFDGGLLESFADKIVNNKVKDPSGLEILENTNLFSVYPNPNKGEFEILFNNDLCKNSEIRLYNTNGRLLYYKTIGPQVANSKYRVHLEKNLHGIFIIQLSSCNLTHQKSFIIE